MTASIGKNVDNALIIKPSVRSRSVRVKMGALKTKIIMGPEQHRWQSGVAYILETKGRKASDAVQETSKTPAEFDKVVFLVTILWNKKTLAAIFFRQFEPFQFKFAGD